VTGPLLSNAALAERFGLTSQYMRVLRMTNRGPKFFRLGGPSSRAFYAEEDVAEWLASRPRYSSTQDEKRAAHAAALAAKPKATRKRASGKHSEGDGRSPRHPARGAERATAPRRSRKKS
jgi:hypothetical protein